MFLCSNKNWNSRFLWIYLVTLHKSYEFSILINANFMLCWYVYLRVILMDNGTARPVLVAALRKDGHT